MNDEDARGLIKYRIACEMMDILRQKIVDAGVDDEVRMALVILCDMTSVLGS